MRQIIFIIISVAFYCQFSFAQVTTVPTFPIGTEPISITFNSSEDNKLGYFTNELYAHTGVLIEGNSEWQHVIGSWGNNTTQPRLTNLGNGIYELEIIPNINSYYSVENYESVIQLAFVFRSSDGSQQTNDLFVDIYENEFVINISSHIDQQMIVLSEETTISAICSSDASLILKINETTLIEDSGTEVSVNHTFNESGWQWLISEATFEGQLAYDSVQVYVTEEQITETKPISYKQGINYLSDDSVALVLWAPEKNYVYVIGDFNNWQPNSNYQMKKDGNFFWLTIQNLVPQKEYVFQYFIDGSIKIGDPYSDRISDPYDDIYITDNIYPNLINYPSDKTEGRASVLQTGQTEYQWQTTEYSIPEKENLHIYELLIRDFTEEKSYQGVLDKLDYLERLGINTIELMPFNEFEGNSSWGYNPNYYFAPDKAYGTKDDLKELIDSCHRRGFIVIQDIVLNHAYGSNPMVMMYWDATNNHPAENNPWFNTSSPNTSYSWGSDFNHESSYTQQFVDSVTSYWMTEYKIDGFRFDFTKGFTNTIGDGSAFDASRINILERMADHIWTVKPDAYIILEHFSENTEEQILTNYKNGMLVWGNTNYSFNEATMGFTTNSDFSWASWQMRDFSQPGLVAYMESHDEERLMYKNLTYGSSEGDYDITEIKTALQRNELAAAFFFCLTGPKMIWQFGEFGYDISIDNNGRTGEKPLEWEYMDDPDHQKLFDVYSAMLRLRDEYPVFTSGTETLNLNGDLKTIQLANGDHYITLIGNFSMTEQTISAPFQHTGIWYEFFQSSTYNATATNMSITLAAGEYRLYSDQQLLEFSSLATNILDNISLKKELLVFPNPAHHYIHIKSKDRIQHINIFSLDGRLLKQVQTDQSEISININTFNNGLYLLQIQTTENTYNQKFIKY